MLPSDLRVKMEDKIFEKLESLNKYMPFINYLIEKDEKKHLKFVNIKRWISSKRKFRLQDLDKMEQSIITQYRNLFLEDVKIPKHIMNIFNSYGDAKCISVNLCSDDEDNDEKDESNDDMEIVSVSFPSAKREEKTDSLQGEDKEITDFLQRVDLICKTPDEQEEIQNYDYSESNNISQSDIQPRVHHEENLFKRREDFMDASLSEKKNQEKSMIDDGKSLNDADYDSTYDIPVICLSDDDADLLECQEQALKANTSELTSQQDSSIISHNDSKSESLNLYNLNALESMDINTLVEIYENFTKQNGIDLELLLRSEVDTTALKSDEKQTVEKFSKPNQSFNKANINFKQNECHQQTAAVTRPSGFVNLSLTPECPKEHGQPISYQSMHLPSSFKKLNLKDPRIVRHLEMIKNSPVYSAVLGGVSHKSSPEMPTITINNSQMCHVPKEPTTYGEYKRLKAEKERKIEINNEHTPTQTEQAMVKAISSTELKSTDKSKSDLKEKLMSTLEPYGDKIADVWRKAKYKTLTKEIAIHKNLSNESKEVKNTNPVQPNSTPDKSKSIEKKPLTSNESTLRTKERGPKVRNPQTSTIITEQKSVKCGEKRKKCNILSHEKKSRGNCDTIDVSSNNKWKFSLSADSPDMVKSNTEGSKMEKFKESVLKNQPQVVLHRLTKSEINKYTRLNSELDIDKPQRTLCVELVENASRKSKKLYDPLQNINTKLNIKQKNIDCLMNERNTKFCVLCKSKPSDLTNHYRRSHKTESYVSRLSWEELDDLELNILFAEDISTNINTRTKKYRVKCVFCTDILEDSFINFFMHYSTHTGEYAFQCGFCKLEKPYRVDIQSHQCHSKMCRGSRVQTLYQYPPNVMAIYLHCCKICNFVQLNEANVFKHLRDHHDKRHDDASYIQKYILAAIHDAEPLDQQSSKTETKLNLPEDEAITVTNEPLTEDFGIENQIEQLGGFNREYESEIASHQEHVPTALNLPEPLSADNANKFEQNLSYNYPNKVVEEPIIHVPMSLPPEENDIKPKLEEFIKTNEYMGKELHSNAEKTVLALSSKSMPVKSDKVNELKFEARGPQSSKLHIYRPHMRYRMYKQGTPYFGLFKCMATDCFFNTDDNAEILQHLLDHSRSEYPPEGYLCCAYCRLDADLCNSPQMLIAHIYKNHAHSRYQCPSCCYRNFSPGQVLIHKNIVHGEDEFTVYECAGPLLEKYPDLSQLLYQNVQALLCPYCSSAFYTCNRLCQHLLCDHKVMDQRIRDQVISKLGQYACIYCSENFNDDIGIQKHLATDHPDVLSYACLRTCKSETMVDSVHDLQLIPVPLPFEQMKIKVVFTSEVRDKNVNCTAHEQTPNTAIMADVKPDLEQCMRIHEDIVKCRLRKLIAYTGITPDRLYRCPQSECGGFFSIYEIWYRHMSLRHNCIICSCPHCPDGDGVELALNNFREHFKQHCCHLFMCFHCGQTYLDENATKEHILESHADVAVLRLEKISLNFNYSVSIFIGKGEYIDRISFLTSLKELVSKQLDYLESTKMRQLKTQWLVPSTTVWLEAFPCFTAYNSRQHKCLLQSCAYKSYDIEELHKHMRSHKIGNNKFSCSKCAFKQVCASWDDVVEHISMHNANLYICCVCSYYHFEWRKVLLHIQQEHRNRDATALSLLRSSQRIEVAISIVFAQMKKTFSSVETCFCCSKRNLRMDSYALHLKTSHGLTFRYFCVICDMKISKLSDCDHHFAKEHPLDTLRLRCELLSNYELIINSITPLTVQTLSGYKSKQITENLPSDFALIKEEPIDADSDGDIVLMDDDDVVIFEESKVCESDLSAAITPHKIKCVNITKLLSKNTNEHEMTSNNANGAKTTEEIHRQSRIFSSRAALQSRSADFSNITAIKPVTIRLINNPVSSVRPQNAMPFVTMQSQPMQEIPVHIDPVSWPVVAERTFSNNFAGSRIDVNNANQSPQ